MSMWLFLPGAVLPSPADPASWGGRSNDADTPSPPYLPLLEGWLMSGAACAWPEEVSYSCPICLASAGKTCLPTSVHITCGHRGHWASQHTGGRKG